MIYIDIGCHNGESIRDFFTSKRFGDGSIDPSGVQSFGIDPLDTYKDEWEKITKEFGTTFINKAAYTHNGDIDFSKRSGVEDVGSSVMRDKKNYERGEIKKVECFDLVDWLTQFKEGEVYMRMDIEGAEYAILRKLLDTGIIDRIKYIEVEFHSKKMGDLYNRAEASIIKKLRMSKTGFKEI